MSKIVLHTPVSYNARIMKSVSAQEIDNWSFKLGANFRLVAKELMARGWSINLFEENPGRRWGYFMAVKGQQTEILASLKYELYTRLNSRVGYFITINKARSYEFAKQFGVPVPVTQYLDADQEVTFKDDVSWPDMVVKPLDGSSGRGITVGIKSPDHLAEAVRAARGVGSRILLQERVGGYDYRLLFLDYRLFAAIRREPASVVGDGTSSVQALIEAKNAIPKSEDFKGTTSSIKTVEVTRVFGEQFLLSVPQRGEKVTVSDKANLSLGGDAYDVSDVVNAKFEAMLAPMIKALGLRICGVDIISTDISLDPVADRAKMLEINAAPNIRPHLYPLQGQARNAAVKIADMLEEAVQGS